MMDTIYYDIEFPPHTLVKGFQSTCRLGYKHYSGLCDYIEKVKAEAPYQMLLLRLINSVTGHVIAIAELASIDYQLFSSLTNFQIASNYVTSIHNYKDLAKAMREVYGEDFSEAQRVTIISYVIQ